jgi:hypothetical protein
MPAHGTRIGQYSARRMCMSAVPVNGIGSDVLARATKAQASATAAASTSSTTTHDGRRGLSRHPVFPSLAPA